MAEYSGGYTRGFRLADLDADPVGSHFVAEFGASKKFAKVLANRAVELGHEGKFKEASAELDRIHNLGCVVGSTEGTVGLLVQIAIVDIGLKSSEKLLAMALRSSSPERAIQVLAKSRLLTSLGVDLEGTLRLEAYTQLSFLRN